MGRRSLAFTIFISGLVLICLLLIPDLVHAQKPAAKVIKNPVPSTPASITAGGKVFRKYCAICHGFKGKGDGPMAPKGSDPPDLTDAMWLHGSTDAAIFTTITTGVGPEFVMVAFKGKIPDQDLWHAINFIRSIGPPNAVR